MSGVAADLGDVAAVNRLIASVAEADILVSNAGPTVSKPFFEIEDEDWERFFQVYVMAAVRLSRQYAQGMIRKGWGRVLFNASVVGGYMSGEMVHWGASKAAVPADRFAREIGAILKVCDAARSRPLNGKALGRQHQRSPTSRTLHRLLDACHGPDDATGVAAPLCALPQWR